jgi:hypothetical protein
MVERVSHASVADQKKPSKKSRSTTTKSIPCRRTRSSFCACHCMSSTRVAAQEAATKVLFTAFIVLHGLFGLSVVTFWLQVWRHLKLGAAPLGPESLMCPKAHGTCPTAPPQALRWSCDFATADEICCFNRHYAEYGGYWQTTPFLGDPFGGAPSDVAVPTHDNPVVFYDTITSKPLYVAPQNRTWDEFVEVWYTLSCSHTHRLNCLCMTGE